MAEFIKADDGRYVNVDHIFEFVPLRDGDSYVAHYPGTDEYGDPASAIVPPAVVRRLVKASPVSKGGVRKTRD